MKVKVKKIKFNDYVPRGVFEQVRWEKDIAMQQLEELGVPFGAKPEFYVKPVTHAHWTRYSGCNVTECSNCYWAVETHWESNYCPYCGAQMDEVIE